MNQVTAALVALQGVDDDIIALRAQRDELASNLDSLRGILGRMESELADKRDKLTEATRFYEEKQVDLQADGERLGRAKAKLTAVTRTKEYAAMQRELDNLRKKYSEDEAELKRLATAIEEYKASIQTQEAKLSELQKEVKREDQASAGRLEELDGKMADIDSRKDGVADDVPPQILKRYVRLLIRREGKAVVPVIDGQCTGCQMRLPPQQYILVQRGETLEKCRSCQRYLYSDDEDSSLQL